MLEFRLRPPFLTGCSHTQHGICSSSCRGNGRQYRGELQHDCVHWMGLRLPGRHGDQVEAEKPPLSITGQKKLYVTVKWKRFRQIPYIKNNAT